MTVIIFARPSVDLDTMPPSSAYNMPQIDLRIHASGSTSTQFPEVLLGVKQVLQNVWVLTEAYQDGMYRSGEKYIEKKGRQ